MIKTFLLAFTILLSTVGIAKAELNFSHASVIIICNSLEGAMSVFEEAQNRNPSTIVIGCYANPSFGAPILSEVKPFLKQISDTAKDWEGDPFAIFEVGEGDAWLIIYNPDNLNQEVGNT